MSVRLFSLEYDAILVALKQGIVNKRFMFVYDA